MINLQFFPSRRIALYMARLFLVRSAAVLVALVGILMMLDLLGKSGDILAYPGNGDAELWRYVALRLPQLVARFLPFAVLLGTLITFAGLNQNSEIISMKAAGISAHQIIAPLILVSALIAVGHFAFSERFVTRANATLAAWDGADFGPIPRESGVQTNVALRHGDDLIFVDRVSGRGASVRLAGITIYGRGGGTLRRILTARTGGAAPGGGWELRNASLFSVDTGTLQRMAAVRVGSDITPDEFTLARVTPDQQDFWQLRRSIADLKAANRSTAALESSLWHKLAGPLSTMLMPLLAAVAAFGLARSGQLMVRAVIGMALGFAYFVADNFAIAMGNLGAYPPFLAAWGPFLLFLLVGEAVLIRTEE
ncbi:MAG: lipopolysaccharide export system permease protein [Sphingomonadales bacterium]|jgi:lipopolysaccharide export system permease protein|nr:lipopolysaccharide export system permease protein [Sphingomonadales bacterium]MEA3045186.1 lipopolysaccharide export system permease protein [Sphingomonadales bacterium]MEA3046641.1 lipopolysaccharide export system permease protein [Sphingomonadales bacterium]